MSFNPKADASPRPRLPRFQRRSTQDKVPFQERCRRNYLNKIHQDRDDKKWENRSERILHKDFLNYQRKWIESHEQSATTVLEHLDENYIEGLHTDVQQQDENMIDLVLSQENEELQALVTLLEDRPNEERLDPDESARYGSDEESYDSIFLELLINNASNKTVSPIFHSEHTGNDIKARVDEAMDTTG